MKLVLFVALALAACIPEPVRAPACAPHARRCTPLGHPALCATGEWVPDTTPDALRCER